MFTECHHVVAKRLSDEQLPSLGIIVQISQFRNRIEIDVDRLQALIVQPIDVHCALQDDVESM